MKKRNVFFFSYIVVDWKQADVILRIHKKDCKNLNPGDAEYG